jgi:hypothetical protein
MILRFSRDTSMLRYSLKIKTHLILRDCGLPEESNDYRLRLTGKLKIMLINHPYVLDKFTQGNYQTTDYLYGHVNQSN